MDIKSMPKIDLHCHIDGSLTQDFVRERIGKCDRMKAPAVCSDLAEYLTYFDQPIACLQTKNDLKAAVLDILKNASLENTKYIELRFAPYFSLNDELSYRDIFESVIDGVKQGLSLYNVHSNIIACAMRHLDTDTNIKMLDIAREYLGYGVCALDLAGDEAAFDNSLFKDLFSHANKIDMPFTIHSGECLSVENVRLALSFGAKRIGHGIALVNDPGLMSQCKDLGVGLELCPTSNYQTRALSPNQPYPLKTFLDNGLLATVNTDNRTVSNTNLTKELSFVAGKFGFDESHLTKLYENSVNICFADDNVKNYLMKELK